MTPIGQRRPGFSPDVFDHGDTAGYHHLVLAPDFLIPAGLTTADEEIVAYEVSTFPARTRGDGHLPGVLRLTAPFRTGSPLLPELRPGWPDPGRQMPPPWQL